MFHFDIYLPPFYNQIDASQPPRNKVKSDAVRILRNNSFSKSIYKAYENKTTSCLKQNRNYPNKLPIVPKLYEFSTEHFKPKLANENSIKNPAKTSTQATQMPKRKTSSETILYDSFASSINLNSDSSFYTISDTDETDFYELNDSNVIDNSYLEFYVKRIDLDKQRKIKDSTESNIGKIENTQNASKPIISISRSRNVFTKQILTPKHVCTYNISNTNYNHNFSNNSGKVSKYLKKNIKSASNDTNFFSEHYQPIKRRDLKSMCFN